METVDSADMHTMNNNTLLKMIWQGHEISRADISRSTGMSRSTVSAIVAKLMQRNLVMERGIGSSKGGRRPVILSLKADAYSIMGIDIGATHISVVLINLRGVVRESRYSVCAVQTQPDLTVELVLEAITAMKKRADLEGCPLIGIGVGLPCPVHPDETVAPMHPNILPLWKNHNLRKIIRARFELPVLFENDANLGALAELFLHKEPLTKNLAFIKMSTGVGLGLLLDGKIHRGRRGLAGELGHTLLSHANVFAKNKREAKSCDSARTLNQAIGVPPLLGRASEVAPKNSSDQHANSGNLSVQRWLEAVEAGESTAEDLFEEAVRDLSFAVINLLVTLDLDSIVFHGSMFPAGDRLIQRLRDSIKANINWSDLHGVELRWSQLGENQIAIGAANLILEKALHDLNWFPAKELEESTKDDGNSIEIGNELASGESAERITH